MDVVGGFEFNARGVAGMRPVTSPNPARTPRKTSRGSESQNRRHIQQAQVAGHEQPLRVRNAVLRQEFSHRQAERPFEQRHRVIWVEAERSGERLGAHRFGVTLGDQVREAFGLRAAGIIERLTSLQRPRASRSGA